MDFARRIYRCLAQAFPHEFKLVYGREVAQLGEDVVTELAGKRSLGGLIRLIADTAIRVPVEYLSEMRRDIRYAWRGLIKSPGFALVGILSMGLAMGLTATVYNSKWQVISRDLPAAANARRLVMPAKPVSYYYIERYRDLERLFTGVAAFQVGIPFNVTLRGDGAARPDRVFGQLVSADYFSVLGVQPQRGRLLDPRLDKRGNAPVVVISDRFWRNRLGSSPGVVGQTLRLNGQPATIVGITPRNFNGALGMNPAELFVPITVPPALAPELADDVLLRRHAREFLAIMCLAPGVTIESAEAALDTMTRRLDEEDPSEALRADKGRRVTLVPAGTLLPIPRNVKPAIVGFFVTLMGLIMTIACMNLANMLLARGAARRKEFAIRLSVGASRFRLVRQMVSEGIVLSLLGGIAGFALSYFIGVVNSRLTLPMAVPVEPASTSDWRAAVFVFVLAVVCGIGFSVVPALRATKTGVAPALKEGSALQVPGYLRFGLRNVLMVAQVTGSLVLLLVTGFLIIGISQVSGVRARVDPRTLDLVCIDPVRDGYTPAKARALFEALPERLQAAGPVRAIVLAAQAPFAVEDEDAAVPLTAGESGGTSRVQISAIEETVGAGYFAALNEPMLAGREFDERDQRRHAGASNSLPVVLNESAARGFFGSANAIGKRVDDAGQSYEVVGVVSDLSNGFDLTRPVLYLPLTERNFVRPPAGGMTIMVRSDAGTDLSGIRRVIASIDPNLTIFNTRTLGDDLERSRAYQRFVVDKYAGMGLFGLILAAVGLAGLTAYAVAQRQKEIGIRMALGARKRQVLLLVLREGMTLVGVGTVFGFLGAIGLATMLSALTSVFVKSLQVGMDDPRLLLGAPLLLAVLTMLACYLPARRATRIDPLRALREE